MTLSTASNASAPVLKGAVESADSSSGPMSPRVAEFLRLLAEIAKRC